MPNKGAPWGMAPAARRSPGLEESARTAEKRPWDPLCKVVHAVTHVGCVESHGGHRQRGALEGARGTVE